MRDNHMKYIILDIDHTLCDTPTGLTLDEFHELDHKRLPINYGVISKLSTIRHENKVQIIFLTSRCTNLYFVTKSWLKMNCQEILDSCYDHHLFMRPVGNIETSDTLKVSTLQALGIDCKDVLFWLDDDELNILHGRNNGYNVIHPNHYLGGVK